MSRTAIFFAFLCAVLPSVLSLTFYNPQTTPPIGAYVSNGGYPSGKPDPSLKFGPTYTQEVAPFGQNVLLSLRQVKSTQNGKYRAVVVAAGMGVNLTATPLNEGAIVNIDPSSNCLATWTIASFMAAYPLSTSAVAASMEGRYVNGVSLNNALPVGSNFIRQQANYVMCTSSQIMGIVVVEPNGINRASPGTANVLKAGFLPWNPQYWQYQNL